MKVSIILPTYNEVGNIIPLIKQIKKSLKKVASNAKAGAASIEPELIVVDDSSPDLTAQAVKKNFGQDKQVRLFVRRHPNGLAGAIWHGIKKSSGQVIVVMDTDFNHDPKLLPQMIEFLKYYDLIIGSRFVMGGDMEDRLRYHLSFAYNFFIRQLLRTQIQDNLSGFFAIKKTKLMKLPTQKIFSGYGDYFFRLLFYAWKEKFQMLEVPVFYRLRFHGQSKSKFLTLLIDYTKALLKLRFSQKQ